MISLWSYGHTACHEDDCRHSGRSLPSGEDPGGRGGNDAARPAAEHSDAVMCTRFPLSSVPASRCHGSARADVRRAPRRISEATVGPLSARDRRAAWRAVRHDGRDRAGATDSRRIGGAAPDSAGPRLMQTTRLADGRVVVAPDGSEIRELVAVERGSMVHCTLPPGSSSLAVAHATVEEVWYFIQGAGQVWRKREGAGGRRRAGCRRDHRARGATSSSATRATKTSASSS